MALKKHMLTLAPTVDLQATYSNYKNTLQQVAQRIGDIEQEAEEHKYVCPVMCPLSSAASQGLE